jgi:hypothetical protein
MASIVVAGDTSGTVTLAAPAVSGTTTLTLPTTSGTVLTSASTITPSAGTVTQASLSTNVVGNGPAFSAYQSANITLTTNTFTKAQINTKEFDTNSNYDNVTNYRFTPTVAGYYQVNGCADLATSIAGTMTGSAIAFYKNGAFFKFCSIPYAGGTFTEIVLTTSALIYMNGSTDYLEMYVRATASGTITSYGNSNNSTFSASMVRSA